MSKDKIIQELDVRLNMLNTDYKTFLYVRTKDLHKSEGLGGGNLTIALTAFSGLSLLSKVNYFISQPDKFATREVIQNAKQNLLEIKKTVGKTSLKNSLDRYYRIPRLLETNETGAFQFFVGCLNDNNIRLGVESGDIIGLRLIWNGFRNFLAHLSTVESGKQVITFEFKHTGSQPTLEERIEKLKRYKAFVSDESSRNWKVYIDVLQVKLNQEILPFVINRIEDMQEDKKSLKELSALITGVES